MLPWVCSVTDHRRRQNMVKTSVTHSPAARVCRVPLFFVLITFWRHLLPITQQTHGNMECETREDKGYPRWWNCKRVCYWSAWMSPRGVFTWHRGDFRAGASSLRFPLRALYLLSWYHHKTKRHAGASYPGVSSSRSGFLLWNIRGWVIFYLKYVARVRRGLCFIPVKIVFLRLTSPW